MKLYNIAVRLGIDQATFTELRKASGKDSQPGSNRKR